MYVIFLFIHNLLYLLYILSYYVIMLNNILDDKLCRNIVKFKTDIEIVFLSF